MPGLVSFRGANPSAGSRLTRDAILLAERRLQVRAFTHRGETVAIAVTNAHDPGKGRVNGRFDGRLNWAHNRNIETPAEIAKTRDAIVSMLTAGTDGDKGTAVSP
jgi:hypothetical protein